jgi:hypothetical protein
MEVLELSKAEELGTNIFEWNLAFVVDESFETEFVK